MHQLRQAATVWETYAGRFPLMRTLRALIVPLAALTVAAGLLLTPTASATPPATITKKSPGSYNVHVKFFNESDREIYLYWSLQNQREVLRPGGKSEMGGKTPAKHDLTGNFRWCPGQTAWEVSCTEEARLDIKWKNPTIGFPWMQTIERTLTPDGLDKKEVLIRFSVGESHTWYPYGRSSEVKIIGKRMTDLSTGTKVWHVTFANAS